jgi:hypothetical protein
LFDIAWNAADAAQAAVVFAEEYAAQVDEDHKAFVQGKSQVTRSLGL